MQTILCIFTRARKMPFNDKLKDNMTNEKPAVTNEAQRLASLHQLLILDSPYEILFDSIVKLASEACAMPIALISLVDHDRNWFKAQVGFQSIRETHREQSFCAHAILDDKIMEVKDVNQDERFKNNELVIGEPHITFYAGAPITMPMGEKIGSVCVIDTKPNELTETQKIVLIGLADIVAKALTARRLALRAISAS